MGGCELKLESTDTCRAESSHVGPSTEKTQRWGLAGVLLTTASAWRRTWCTSSSPRCAMEAGSSDSDSDAPPEVASSKQPAMASRPGDKLARSNKNRPSQLPIRRPVSKFRIAPGLRANPKAEGCDPRFDHDGREPVNEAGWRKSYDFVFQKMHEEAAEMKQTLKESSKVAKRGRPRGGGEKKRRVRQRLLGEDDAAAMRLELERTQNRLAQDARRAKQERVRAEARSEEVAAVKEGKKPFFQKRSALRERELLSHFEELKREGKLEKFLAKKRKKMASKQHRSLPERE